MTRFARGKSSHQRVAGDSTPWTDLKTAPPKEEGAGFDRKRGGSKNKSNTTAGGDGGNNNNAGSENVEGKLNTNKGKNFKKGGGGGGGGPSGGKRKFEGKNNNKRRSGGSRREDQESANFTPLGGRDKNVNVRGQGQTKVVKIFGNFWVGEEDARRLQGLVKKLKAQGLSRKDILDALQNERRRAEKAAKRRRDKICFNCRQFGHVLADCTKGNEGGGEGDEVKAGGGGGGEAEICFKCGSTEHTSRNCKKKADTFQFAKCFVCQKSGHIARQCPSNTKGIYPTGGSCDECGSISHLKKDCPDIIGVDTSAGNEDSVMARITDPFVSPEAEDFSMEIETQNSAEGDVPRSSSVANFSKNPKKMFKNKGKLGKRKFEESSISTSPSESQTSVSLPLESCSTNMVAQKKRKVVKF